VHLLDGVAADGPGVGGEVDPPSARGAGGSRPLGEAVDEADPRGVEAGVGLGAAAQDDVVAVAPGAWAKTHFELPSPYRYVGRGGRLHYEFREKETDVKRGLTLEEVGHEGARGLPALLEPRSARTTAAVTMAATETAALDVACQEYARALQRAVLDGQERLADTDRYGLSIAMERRTGAFRSIASMTLTVFPAALAVTSSRGLRRDGKNWTE
jgi:hypothetical protein